MKNVHRMFPAETPRLSRQQGSKAGKFFRWPDLQSGSSVALALASGILHAEAHSTRKQPLPRRIRILQTCSTAVRASTHHFTRNYHTLHLRQHLLVLLLLLRLLLLLLLLLLLSLLLLLLLLQLPKPLSLLLLLLGSGCWWDVHPWVCCLSCRCSGTRRHIAVVAHSPLTHCDYQTLRVGWILVAPLVTV